MRERRHAAHHIFRPFHAFCDEAHAAALETSFAQRATIVVGGPRALAHAVDAIRLCAAAQAIEAPQADAFLNRN